MTAMILAWIGIVMALFASWLGGELVYRLNVGVDRGANLDAPNSLSGRPAMGGLGRRSKRGVIRARWELDHDQFSRIDAMIEKFAKAERRTPCSSKLRA